MVCPFTVAVRVGLAVFVLKTVYDAVCIYRKNHPAAPANDDDDAKKPTKKNRISSRGSEDARSVNK
jgi:hypothetical protein